MFPMTIASLQRSFCVRAFLLLTVFCLIGTPLFGACHAVSPSGSGTMSGADWNDAYANLPSNLVRGDVYYLADGNYGTSLNVTTAASGTTTITIKKAQAYDYGRASDGCPNDISAGWSASTMGAAQAVWQNTASGGSAFIHFGSGGYYIINGNGQSAPPTIGCGGVQANSPSAMTSAPPTPTDCGIKWDDSTCTSTATNGCDGGTGMINGGGPGIQLSYTEVKGQGLNSNGNNNSETYGWFASGGNLSGVTLTRMYFHNMSTTDFTSVSGGWDNGCSFSYNYSWGVFDGSANHGEAIQLQGSNGQTTACGIHHNIFRDQQTNGDVVAVITGTETFNFYDNLDFCSSGGTSTSCRHNDGIIGCFNSQTCASVKVYNNTFAEPSDCGFNVTGGASTISWENNLLYSCGSMTTNNGSGGTNTIDYNSYLNSYLTAIGSHDVVNNNATNPFVGPTTGNYQLLSDGSNYNNRVTLGSPFDTLDLYGGPFTTDRGAAQFAPSSPINLSGSVSQ
jgi:hypothetical protein